jgi:hypothetical protein
MVELWLLPAVDKWAFPAHPTRTKSALTDSKIGHSFFHPWFSPPSHSARRKWQVRHGWNRCVLVAIAVVFGSPGFLNCGSAVGAPSVLMKWTLAHEPD